MLPTPNPTPAPAATPSPSPAATPEPTVPPLPRCRFGDEVTAATGHDDWATTLVDAIYRLPAGYAPPDLTSVRRAGFAGSSKVRSLMIADLRALKRAATRAGVALYVTSGYRSYRTQADWYKSSTAALGLRAGRLRTARAGHSEHQLGTTLDFAGNLTWLAKNGWRYGFVMSYPRRGSPSVTCVQYEPWHYRYFGREAAAAIHGSRLTSREYLWGLQHTGDATASAASGS
jgi:D-alanyl-D-alanine carboxypeptidase